MRDVKYKPDVVTPPPGEYCARCSKSLADTEQVIRLVHERASAGPVVTYRHQGVCR